MPTSKWSIPLYVLLAIALPMTPTEAQDVAFEVHGFKTLRRDSSRVNASADRGNRRLRASRKRAEGRHLSQACYDAEDCAPGPFEASGLRTQCEVTPFSDDGTVCCKPFATPCDSGKACCSGYCDPSYARCADTTTEALESGSSFDEGVSTPSTPPPMEDERIVATTPPPVVDHDTVTPSTSNIQHAGDTTPTMAPSSLPPSSSPPQANTSPHAQTATRPPHNRMKIDPDGPYARGRSYTTDADDFYGGYDSGSSVNDIDEAEQMPQPRDGEEETPRTPNGRGGKDERSDRYTPKDEKDCVVSYSSGMMETAATSKARVQAVAMDSQGNVFYSLGFDDGIRGEIRRVSAGTKGSPLPINDVGRRGNDHSKPGHDKRVYTGGGIILAMAVDADDNLIFTMGNASLKEGAVCLLEMASGGIHIKRSGSKKKCKKKTHHRSAGDDVDETSSTTAGGSSGDDSQSSTELDNTSSGDDFVYTTELGGSWTGDDGSYTTELVSDSSEDDDGLSGTETETESLPDPSDESSTNDDSDTPPTRHKHAMCHGATPLASHLGPFMPGVAVCPVTGDILVARGHTALIRLIRGRGGTFETQVEWAMDDIKFTDGDRTPERAPLMIWDLAVDRSGVVYMTTYVQGVVLKGIFPRDGGGAKVRLVAGTWDSGVSLSSGDGGRANAAALAFPKGIAIGGDDTVYVAEFQGDKIRALAPGGAISACAGTGQKRFNGDGGTASNASMNMPNALAFSPGTVGGPMAIADFGNSAVRMITPSCT